MLLWRPGCFVPDVLVEVPPHDEKQIGPVMLLGSRQIWQWADKFARTDVELAYLLKPQTENEVEGERMVYFQAIALGRPGCFVPDNRRPFYASRSKPVSGGGSRLRPVW